MRGLVLRWLLRHTSAPRRANLIGIGAAVTCRPLTYQAKPTFPHRHNKDGTVDSICSECLLTVATVRDERELTQHEEVHVCDPYEWR
jgi:hypothetical protein